MQHGGEVVHARVGAEVVHLEQPHVSFNAVAEVSLFVEKAGLEGEVETAHDASVGVGERGFVGADAARVVQTEGEDGAQAHDQPAAPSPHVVLQQHGQIGKGQAPARAGIQGRSLLLGLLQCEAQVGPGHDAEIGGEVAVESVAQAAADASFQRFVPQVTVLVHLQAHAPEEGVLKLSCLCPARQGQGTEE